MTTGGFSSKRLARVREVLERDVESGYGWNGGYGVVWYNDPAEDMTAILTIQRAAGRPTLPIFLDFLTAAYQAIDD